MLSARKRASLTVDFKVGVSKFTSFMYLEGLPDWKTGKSRRISWRLEKSGNFTKLLTKIKKVKEFFQA
jgi:hypothetical protein